MAINITYICDKLYPGQIELGNIRFKQLEKLEISVWQVPNVEKPSEAYLESLFPEYERQFQIDEVSIPALYLIQQLLEAQAKSKNYDSSLSCASYANSQNLQWKVEADAFIAWRDAVWAYAYNLFEVAQQGGNIPSVEEVMQNLPVITWP